MWNVSVYRVLQDSYLGALLGPKLPDNQGSTVIVLVTIFVVCIVTL